MSLREQVRVASFDVNHAQPMALISAIFFPEIYSQRCCQCSELTESYAMRLSQFRKLRANWQSLETL